MLKLEKTYTNKEGQEIELKTPKMKLVGSDMDELETHEFVILRRLETHEPGTQYNKGNYPKHQMYVKYENSEQAFNLELSNQAKIAIEQSKAAVGDRIIISRIQYDQKYVDKDGSEKTRKNKGVGVQVIKNTNPTTPNAPVKTQQKLQTQDKETQLDLVKDINEFLLMYKEQVSIEQQNMTHLLSVWFKNKHREEAEKIIAFFQAYLEKHVNKSEKLNI